MVGQLKAKDSALGCTKRAPHTGQTISSLSVALPRGERGRQVLDPVHVRPLGLGQAPVTGAPARWARGPGAATA